jgi:hypothetical protein
MQQEFRVASVSQQLELIFHCDNLSKDLVGVLKDLH